MSGALFFGTSMQRSTLDQEENKASTILKLLTAKGGSPILGNESIIQI